VCFSSPAPQGAAYDSPEPDLSAAEGTKVLGKQEDVWRVPWESVS